MAFDVVQARKDAFAKFDQAHGGNALYIKQMALWLWSDGAWCERDNPDMAHEPDERQDSYKLEYAKEKLERLAGEYNYRFSEAKARSDPATRAYWGCNAAPIPTDQELEEIRSLRNQVRSQQKVVDKLQEIVDEKREARRPPKDERELNRASEVFNKLQSIRL